MAKIPVGATIRRSYQFAFGNFVNNLGAIWMPFILMMVAGYFLQAHQISLISSMQDFNPGQQGADAMKEMQQNWNLMMKQMPYLTAYMFLTYACMASISVAITREALQLREGNPYLQFPFGERVWILLGSYILAGLIFVGLYLVFVIAVMIVFVIGAVGHSAGGVVGGLSAAAGVLVGIAAWCAMMYCMVRFSFLLTPVVIVEGEISFRRAWRLAKGNFWRIIIIGIAVWLPFVIVMLVFLAFLYKEAGWPPVGATPEDVNMWSQQISVFASQKLTELMENFWYIYFPVSAAIFTLLYGLICGVNAFAYKALILQQEQVP